jgi:hypothetical protein
MQQMLNLLDERSVLDKYQLPYSLPLTLSDAAAHELVEGACSYKPVAGLTHTFYQYPARFSPVFVRAAIRAFTCPGEIVMDPFMGGATTIVEASALGRRSIGLDISALSMFLARAKAIPIADSDLTAVAHWATRATKVDLNLRQPPKRAAMWAELGYQRNIEGRHVWAIRKILELGVASIEQLKSSSQKIFARAVLLRTGQWALDCRIDVTSKSHASVE